MLSLFSAKGGCPTSDFLPCGLFDPSEAPRQGAFSAIGIGYEQSHHHLRFTLGLLQVYVCFTSGLPDTLIDYLASLYHPRRKDKGSGNDPFQVYL